MHSLFYTFFSFLQNEKELKFSQDHFFKFMLVRHPMERLVSCYFDKMVNGTHKSLKGFRKFVKMRAEKIRKERLEKVNILTGVYNPSKDDRPIGSYPKSNPWLGFDSPSASKPNKKFKKRPKRSIATNQATNYTNSTNSHSNRSKNDEPMIIPTLDDFFEFILTDLSGN